MIFLRSNLLKFMQELIVVHFILGTVNWSQLLNECLVSPFLCIVVLVLSPLQFNNTYADDFHQLEDSNGCYVGLFGNFVLCLMNADGR